MSKRDRPSPYLIFPACYSDDARTLGFTVLVDMRGATWSTVKPILKALHEHFPPGAVHQALIVKPDNFWQKQRTSLGSHKYKFEVRVTIEILALNQLNNRNGK